MSVPDYVAALTGEIRGLRLGVPREYFVNGMEPGVEAAVRDAITVLEGLGAEVVEVSLPSTDSGLATYYIIAPAEASANLARYDGVKYGLSAGEDELLDNYLRTRGSGFGDEVKRRIMLGTYALSAGYYDAFYVKAQQVRTLIKAEFDAVLADVDALIAPTSPSVAFKIGAKTQDPLLMYLNDACTLPVNIAGLPGISVPCGLSDGLPVGLQVIGRAFDEATVLRVADAYERAAGFDHLRPPTATRTTDDRDQPRPPDGAGAGDPEPHPARGRCPAIPAVALRRARRGDAAAVVGRARSPQHGRGAGR